MADEKITQLPVYTTPQTNDVIPIVDISGPTTKKITRGTFLKSATATVVIAASNTPNPVGADYICTGTADQTIIQTAITAVCNAGGGVVYFREGTYNTTNNITITAGNITITGAGEGATVFVTQGKASSGTEGVFVVSSGSGAALSNITFRNFSINMNNITRNGITLLGANVSTTGYNYLLENLEFYGRMADASGFSGNVLIISNYGSFPTGAGMLQDVTFRNLYFHDGNPTTLTNQTGESIGIFSDTLSNFSLLDCIFANVYGNTINLTSGTGLRTRKNWLMQGCDFITTKQLYFSSSVGDFFDTNRNGFDGLLIDDCYFNDQVVGWTANQDVYNILFYQTYIASVQNCIFEWGRDVMAPGFSEGAPLDGNLYSQFCNNIVYQYQGFMDFDSNYVSIYSDNLFANIQNGDIFGGYGRHYPTLYQNNIVYNCLASPANLAPPFYRQAILLLEDGGNILQDNLFYDDLGGTSGALYIFGELGGGTNTFPNVYQNNIIYGYSNLISTFYLDSSYQHVIKGNFGIQETTLQNSGANGSPSVSTLSSADIVDSNYTQAGGSVQQFYLQGNVTGATTFNRINGEAIQATLTGNITVTLTGSGRKGETLTLKLVQGGSGSNTYTKTGTTKLAGGTITLTSAIGAIDTITFSWDGTNWNEIGRALNLS